VPGFSRSYLQQLVEEGAVRLAGSASLKSSQKVRAGEAGEIDLRPTPQSQAFLPEPLPLSVLHEDEHLLVIDKPAGLVVHPAPGNWSGTLLNGLLAHDGAAQMLPRAGIVHRLDKDTSGLMAVARSRAAMDALVQAIAAREVARQYMALAHRPWIGPKHRQVDAPIGRDPRNRLRMAVVDLERHPGKAAVTGFDLLENADAGCLVRATLQTGRTHQIRVHMAAIKHPCVGDVTYGADPTLAKKLGLERQWLHAVKLSFAHPSDGRWVEFESPYAPDLQRALDVIAELS
jgi:23S rRNA pseudouridine1911/1915/1917 synthase